jgi:hypothetical protein
MRIHPSLIAILLAALTLPAAAQRRVPKDLSDTRGFNYQAGEANGHLEFWLHYNPAVTRRDLDYAKRLQLNQIRVMVPYAAWAQDKQGLQKNLIDFVRAAHERGMGVMPALQYKFGYWRDKSTWSDARPFAADLVAAVGKEPGLVLWDVENEPECCKLPPTPDNRLRMEHAMYMANLFHELDPVTPVTIGATFAENMIAMGDSVDVLSFHDYSTTRAQIRANIETARAYAEKVGKPLINSEMGCIARANPYDVTLQEYQQAHVGWYIWELMITPNWGSVHGVFYPDGTVRDPSIAAALLGFFRNRGDNVVESVPDRENHLTEAVAADKAWLANPAPDWQAGLNLAEVSANLIEAAQLAPMHVLPSRQVILLRKAKPDLPALHSLLEKFTALLEPYQLPPGDPRRSHALAGVVPAPAPKP